MTVRLEKWIRDNVHTYRVVLDAFTTSTAAGAFVTITGEDNRTTKLRHTQISKADQAMTLRIASIDVAPTTGTYTEVSPTRISHPAGSTYGGTARTYTVIPTLGGTTNPIQTIDLSTSEVLNEHYGDPKDIRTPTITGSTSAFIFTSSVAAGVALDGYIEFTREPST